MNLFIFFFILASAWTLFCAARHIQAANRKPKQPGLSDWRGWPKGVFQ